MNDKNWPDPKRKGYPLNHKVSAWHLLRTGSGIDTPFYWDAIKIRWKSIGGDWFTPAMIMDICKYQGATFTPAQIAEMLASERDRCAKEADKHRSDANPHAVSDWDVVQTSTANDIAKAIRNLGYAP